MLPNKFRFTLKNETGVTIDAGRCIIKYRGKYFDTNGKLTFEGESGDVAGQTSSILNGNYHNGTTIDNGAKTNPILEADVYIDINLTTNTATPNGIVLVYLDRATADTPGYGTNGLGEVIAVAHFPNSKVQRTMVVNVG